MNESQETRLRDVISTRLNELKAEDKLGAEGQSVVVLDQQSVGRLSRMDAIQNQAMAVAQQKSRDQETLRLQATLSRLDDPEFGHCEECGDEIAMGRLELNPANRRCINCARGS